MSDEKLRALERAAQAGDKAAHVKHRQELIRLGRVAEAGLELGDVTVYRTHRMRLVGRSMRKDNTPGRRVQLVCLSHELRCGADGWKNLDSKGVGVLAEPTDEPRAKLPVGEGEHGPARSRRDNRVYPGSRGCLCDFRCDGGMLQCSGCGGDFCVCRCGGEAECDGCDECREDDVDFAGPGIERDDGVQRWQEGSL